MLPYEQPSPVTSNATTRTNRGGRPKEWTETRARRLTRLYCFTSLKVDQILEVLKDDVWVPGKEAANKHLNHLLGKDPRWIRPKDINEQRLRIAGLKKSERAKKPSTSCHPPDPHAPTPANGPEDSFYLGLPRADTLDGTTLARSSKSSLEETDAFMTGQIPVASLHTYNYGPAPLLAGADFMDPNHPSNASLSRFIPVIGSRQGTSLTTSTDFSVGSNREAFRSVRQKLVRVDGLGSSDIKDIFRLLKRFTLSNDSDGGHSNHSPNTPLRSQHEISGNDFDDYDKKQVVTDLGIATYPLPGDFIYSDQPYDEAIGRDRFGNTTFHIHAATEGLQRELIQLVSNNLNDRNGSVNAVNTGKQTFLHVLHDSWFQDGSLLNDLVDKLRTTDFNFYVTDVYGRTFFHLLRQKVGDNERIRDITRHFNVNLLNRRDAFGVRPMILRAMTIPSTKDEGFSRLTIPTTGRDQERIRKHEQLLKTINDSYSSPNRQGVEDSQGRNALHCLSEVILGFASISAHANGTRAPKRRMDEQDEPIIHVCPLSHRLQYLECVLDANVDVNHYNASGDTVLMSFISNIIDGQDDKDLETLIKRLLTAGASLEARNRNGETVLHVAARLGQKFAVKVLLEQGSNPHVRNCDGRSVLQTIDDLIQLSYEYADQTARLEATRGVLTGRFSKFEAQQDPSLLQEWAIR